MPIAKIGINGPNNGLVFNLDAIVTNQFELWWRSLKDGVNIVHDKNIVNTSPWEKLETEIERAERQKKSPDLKKIESNSIVRQWKFSTDDLWILIASGAGIIGLLLPHFLFIEPLGIDWIGFATLADTLASTGTTELPPPSIGNWTYPPALPSTAAWIMTMTGIDSATSVSLIGHLGMGLLCASLAGVFARFGAGGAMLVSMVLSAGLFAKMFDSGYPTVLSQLGFILGLLVVLNNEKRFIPKGLIKF